MEFFADYHTHTKYSDGHGTIEENALAAREAGLDKIGIADHGPQNIGVGVQAPETYLEIKQEIEKVAAKVPEVEILLGAEADITGLAGEIDISPKIVKELDFLVVGLHPHVWGESIRDFFGIVVGNKVSVLSKGLKEKTRTSNTKALIECINRNPVFCISHPNLKMPVDVEELASQCVKNNVALEINTGHRYNKNDLIKQALPTGVNFVVNSDAHFPETVGQLAEGKLLLNRYNVGVERVLNAK